MTVVINDERFRKLLRAYPMEAIKVLYDLHYKNLLLIAMNLTCDRKAAEDIVQDTFLILYTKRNEISKEHEKGIENYLVRIVRNRSVSFYKRTRHFDIDNLDFLKQYTGTENAVEVSLIEKELVTEMRTQISNFPRRERQCLFMKIDREMSLDQIAAELNISRKMVEKSQTKALKRLRTWAASKK
jgi:RNA polymerase sigma factor (sigma-70 family)